ncbi:ester cyclase [Kitasatospora sp. NPDC056327]|uniref:ester cyclase n=1 Tax=Kitasatospora sp. NPDC056327 TaxID=3345785 RepID=UPI0035DAB6C3
MNIPAERDEHFRTWAHAISTDDLEAYLSCYADDLRVEDLAVEMVVEDKPGLRGAGEVWFTAFHDHRLTLDGYLVGEHGEIGTRWTLSATVAGHFPGLTENAVMGRRFTKHGLSVFTFSPDGRFRTEVAYWNLATLVRQIT